ncbi:unnamed protein product [Cylicostephanus goldi]|uniref:NADP-dependent oxidoreductase domain-containing protein n=1 Tax=Cylicostephanus goldi TaxID=71465 RepID=A0A3P6QMK0_CYLGO|nr:unnamed protein product [Cylicostephanus goldi]
MQYRRLGQTDMIVSKISFGSAPIGGMFGNVEDSITQIVETALRNDPDESSTESLLHLHKGKDIVAHLLQNSAFHFSVGRFELDFARNFDYRADEVLESLVNSLKRLRLTYIDVCFIQIHDADFESQRNIILYETLQALEMARSSGKIRYIGLAGYGLRRLASLIDCSSVRIDVVQTYSHGSMNDNSVGEFTFMLQNKGIGILNGSPLSMGLLTDQGPPPWHPAPDFIKETCLAATHYCMVCISKNMSISKLALAYAFQVPGMSSCIVGMDSVQQVGVREIELEK